MTEKIGMTRSTLGAQERASRLSAICGGSWLPVTLGLITFVSLGLSAEAQTREHRAVGVAQTGPNDRCGDPIWTFTGLATGPGARGTFIGLRDDNIAAVSAIPLVASDCGPTPADPDALVATNYDAAFGTHRGWTVPSPDLENLGFRSIPVPAGNGVRAPIPLPGSVPPNPLPPTIAEPTDPVTLERWLSASGDLEIICDDAANTASIAAQARNLIPNGVYTMWGQWLEPSGTSLLVVPFGGLPNSMVADEQGNAEYCREVRFCPLDLAPDASELQLLSLVYHGDGVSYGSVPFEAFTTRAFVGVASLPFLSSIPGGIVSFDQLGFRINGSGGPDPGLTSPMMCIEPGVTVAGVTPWSLGAMCLLVAAFGAFRLRRPATA